MENIFIYPFILIGRIYARFQPEINYNIYFFFPFYHIGGAEKVHAQIAKSFRGEKAIIFFTKKSLNDFFWNEFKQAGHKMVDVSKYTDNKWMYYNNLIYRGILSHHINRQTEKPVVFNGQCNFGYKISPWINSRIPQLELIHSLCSFSYIRIPFMEYYYKSVMISKKRIKDHEDLYDKYRIPEHYKRNIAFILNAIQLPSQVKKTINEHGRLRVLYVGRDTEEKRVDLIATIAKEIISVKQMPAEFIFMGEVKNAIPESLHPYCVFLGNQNDDNKIDEIYREADVLLMVSTTEGFPMAIMEAMARGLTIVSTAVGEIPYHVKDDENGYLINDTQDSNSVFKHAVAHVTNLIVNRNLLAKFRQNNITHANKNFSLDRFEREYTHLFEEAKQHFRE